MRRILRGTPSEQALGSLPAVDFARARASLRLSALDGRDRLRGRHDALIPPRRRDAAGHSDFATSGEELVTALTAHARLLPGSRVLDVGCRHGAVARGLTRVLGPGGSYDGFDIDRDAVGWCRRAYRGHRNFRFVVADEWVFERLREHGLVLTDLHPGSWSGREEHMHFQDVLVAVRDGA